MTSHETDPDDLEHCGCIELAAHLEAQRRDQE